MVKLEPSHTAAGTVKRGSILEDSLGFPETVKQTGHVTQQIHSPMNS